MVYILDRYIGDGQAIHHSDSRQVLNLDGGSAVTGRVGGMDDDDGYPLGLWLHDDQSGQTDGAAVCWMVSDSRVARVVGLTGSCGGGGGGPLSPWRICSL